MLIELQLLFTDFELSRSAVYDYSRQLTKMRSCCRSGVVLVQEDVTVVDLLQYTVYDCSEIRFFLPVHIRSGVVVVQEDMAVVDRLE